RRQVVRADRSRRDDLARHPLGLSAVDDERDLGRRARRGRDEATVGGEVGCRGQHRLRLAAHDPDGGADRRGALLADPGHLLKGLASHGDGVFTAAMNFSLSSEKVADGADYVVSLGGEVDLYTAPELKQELHRLVGEGATRIVIDMSDTTFIDSTTLGVLLSVVKRVRPERGAVVLVGPDR